MMSKIVKSNLVPYVNDFRGIYELPVLWGTCPLSDDEPAIERYGGNGIGSHGGGARSVVIGRYHYKGIGLTSVAGHTENPNYNHGTLTLSEAVYEAIYSGILENLMPVGAVSCPGILYAGQNKAYAYTLDLKRQPPKAHGAILVRELCERPGHFMRAGNFHVKAECNDLICDDVTRIRKAIKEFTGRFEHHNDFVFFIGRFLAACANQFGFARVAGLVHGGLTPSNLATDGRWLDLATSTFVDRGRDYLITHYPFYREADVPLDILREWISTYCKYNGVDFDIIPLVNYYKEQLQSYTHYHAAYILGFERNTVANMQGCEIYDEMVKELMAIAMPPSRVYELDHLKNIDDDSLIRYLHRCFSPVSAFGGDRRWQDLAHIIYQNSDREYGEEAWLKRTIIKAFKRAYLPVVFYRQRLMDTIDDIIDADDIAAIPRLIDTGLFSASWIFDDEFGSEEWIYQNGDLRLTFDLSRNSYVIDTSTERHEEESLSKLLVSRRISSSQRKLCGYDCTGYLQALESHLDQLDTVDT